MESRDAASGARGTGSDPRFAAAALRKREGIATGARSEPRPCNGARSWIGAPRLCRANRHLEPEFKRVACQDHQALPRRERTPVRLRLGNLAKLALVQRVYGRLEHRRGQ
jgi:hypothetical protein